MDPFALQSLSHNEQGRCRASSPLAAVLPSHIRSFDKMDRSEAGASSDADDTDVDVECSLSKDEASSGGHAPLQRTRAKREARVSCDSEGVPRGAMLFFTATELREWGADVDDGSVVYWVKKGLARVE